MASYHREWNPNTGYVLTGISIHKTYSSSHRLPQSQIPIIIIIVIKFTKISMTRGKEKHIPNCRHGQGRHGESGANEKKCLLLGFRLAYQMYAAPATTATNANDSPTCVALSCCCSCPISPAISSHARPLLLSPSLSSQTHCSRVWEPLLLCSLSLSLSRRLRPRNPKNPKSAPC
jgi:hypothetical protein